MALEGICPNCGTHYFGWAMQFPQHKTCDICSAEIEILNGVRKAINHNSLHTIKKRVIDLLNTHIIPNNGNKENNHHEEDSK